MKKGGGTEQEAKKLADKFQQQIVDVTVAKDAIDEENRVITDKDVDGNQAEEAAPTNPAISFRTRISIRARCSA